MIPASISSVGSQGAAFDGNKSSSCGSSSRGSSSPSRPEAQPGLQLLLRIPALAASNQTLKFQPWRTLDSGGSLLLVSSTASCAAAVEDCSVHPSTHTMALTGIFSSTVIPHTDILQSWGLFTMKSLPRHFQPLKSKLLGFLNFTF